MSTLLLYIYLIYDARIGNAMSCKKVYSGPFMAHERQTAWPQYSNELEAMTTETQGWGDRLEIAERRYEKLDGTLPTTLGRMVICVVDGNERPDMTRLPAALNEQGLPEDSLGLLMLVNYEGKAVLGHTEELAQELKLQRDAYPHVPTAIGLLGYQAQRKMHELRRDVWDMAIVHGLRSQSGRSIVGVSLDADTVSMAPGTIDAMTSDTVHDRQATVWRSSVSYDTPGGAELPLNRMTAYLTACREIFRRYNNAPVTFGGGLAMTLGTYAIAGGWAHSELANRPSGAGEPTQLVLNVWERMSGMTATKADATAARAQCTADAGGHVVVSPRRELYAFSRILEEGMSALATSFTTDNTNPTVRQLGYADMVRMAAELDTHQPRYHSLLDGLDTGFLSEIPAVSRPDVRVYLRQMRLELGLPLPEDNP